MDLEQSVKNLQVQNTEFQALILTLSKGQDELKALLTKKDKKTKKPREVIFNLAKGQEELKVLLFLGYNYNARCAYYSNNPGYGVKDGRPLKHAIKDLIMTLKSEKTTTMKSRH